MSPNLTTGHRTCKRTKPTAGEFLCSLLFVVFSLVDFNFHIRSDRDRYATIGATLELLALSVSNQSVDQARINLKNLESHDRLAQLERSVELLETQAIELEIGKPIGSLLVTIDWVRQSLFSQSRDTRISPPNATMASVTDSETPPGSRAYRLLSKINKHS